MDALDEIKKQYEQLNPLEVLLKAYLQKTGSICKVAELPDLMDTVLHDRSEPTFSDYLRMDSFRRLLEDIRNRKALSMTDEFLKDTEDMAVFMHPRYFATGLHAHNFYEVVYVNRGKAVQTVQTNNELISFTQGQGTFLLMPPGISHSICVDDESLVFNLVMKTEPCKRSLLSNLPTGSELERFFVSTLYSSTPLYLLITTNNDSAIQKAFFEIVSSVGNDLYKRSLQNLRASVFFLELLAHASSENVIHREHRRNADYIPVIIQFIEKNYASVTSETIAECFGFTQSYIGFFYKKFTDKTLSQTIQSVRIRHAQELLMQTSLKVSDICEAIGYADTTSFIRRFKQLVGETPYQYRLHRKSTNTSQGPHKEK